MNNDTLEKLRDDMRRMADVVSDSGFAGDFNFYADRLDAIINLNKHDWKPFRDGSISLYESVYECSKCRTKHTESADDLSTAPPVYGCGTKDDLQWFMNMKDGISTSSFEADIKHGKRGNKS